ncbi:hypothetical protein BDV32DRAFT_151107 [Aspergillus pseudonomiae]|uniref:Uncharacterized protein n=1 Tax=Aspergillus pseudonomiae TaxID=1506151 RepID=A0A5N6HW16_9EURO|nr:uncharacterized protein BDV37DRAFT_91522 [Aspergillus pseudonomiae]KAB8258662.1 hypothetical protein BDV32DRAFT_151107 [Aspergillus pseudonomiae]KAE8405409.1 hypothetical protein BDV37DRAFT_91522 [Aspergillus pseudonomiae]
MESPPVTGGAKPTSNLKKFRCAVCDKGYSKLEHLTRHERTHVNLKPFHCTQCNKAFGRQDVLNRHMKLHQNRPAPSPTASIAHQQQQVATSGAVLAETPAPPATSLGPPDYSLEQPRLFDQSLLANPYTQESENLLDWLMPDFLNTSSLLLPMTDLSDNSRPLISALSCLRSVPPADAQGSPGQHAVHEVHKLVDDLSKRLNDDLHNTGVTPPFVDACLREYFRRVSPSFPILHEPTFSVRDCISPLLLNMVALGSLFVCLPNAAEQGEMLWKLGHTAVAASWQSLIEVRGPQDQCNGIQLVLTALLGQTYALLSSNTSIRTTAFVFHGLGFYWARTSGMYSVDDLQLGAIPSLEADSGVKEAAWRTWVAAEVQRRATLGHYVLDGLISQASGSAASARHLTNKIGTACSDAAFAAETADEWIIEMARLDHVRIPFSELFIRVCAKDYIKAPLQLSLLSVAVLLEGLQSLIAELHDVDGPALGTVPRSQIIRGLLNIYEGDLCISRSVESLQNLIRWHAACIELSTPTIFLYRRICDEYKLPQVLSGIPVRGCARPLNITSWAQSIEAFRAVLHAVSIIRLVNELPNGHTHAMHIPGCVFAASMILIAIHLWNKTKVKIPKSLRWHDVWAGVIAENNPADETPLHENIGYATTPASVLPSISPISADFSGAEEIIHTLNPTGADDAMTSVNILSEVNSLQISLKTVASRWRISSQMEEIIGRLAILPRQ